MAPIPDTILLRHTDVWCRDQRVTIVGVPSDGLLAIIGYGSTRLRVLGVIAVRERNGQSVYRVDGHGEDLPDLDTAAAILATQHG
jgi:hypothetical protein